MIKIDFKAFIYNRIWFGYSRGAIFKWHDEDHGDGGEWVQRWVKITPAWPWIQ